PLEVASIWSILDSAPSSLHAQGLDLTEPILALDFGVPVEEVVADLHKPAAGLGRGAQEGAPDAGIRCPMLHVKPKMLALLSELEADLLQRRTQAETEGWIGEIEGIDLTLTFLRAKRDETQRRAQRSAVHLGIPTRRRPQESE
ncbi:hypothetical protein ACFWAX_35890, partial [Streptomyces sp. NPDC059956]